jgi:hypothetical protein
MQRFFTFWNFLQEKEVAMSPQLQTVRVQDLGDGKFSYEMNGAPIQFSVIPIPTDLEEINEMFVRITTALKNGVPLEMFKVAQEAQNSKYAFGNLVSSSLSLNNVKNLSISITDEQRKLLNTSEEEFLKTQFSLLDKKNKDAIIEYLREICMFYGVFLECLFYYTRSGDTEKFYQGKDFFNILREYQSVVDTCEKNLKINFSGPFSNAKMENKVDSPVEYAYWKFSKKSKNFLLRATTSTVLLNSEENIQGKKGLNASIITGEEKEISKELNNFPIYELEERISKL